MKVLFGDTCPRCRGVLEVLNFATVIFWYIVRCQKCHAEFKIDKNKVYVGDHE